MNLHAEVLVTVGFGAENSYECKELFIAVKIKKTLEEKIYELLTFSDTMITVTRFMSDSFDRTLVIALASP